MCEDHTLDQYILKPIIKLLLKTAGKPNAQVNMVTNPRIGGFDQLRQQLPEMLTRYCPLADLIIVATDMDCESVTKNQGKPARISRIVQSHTCDSKTLVIGAQQEIEVWAMWGSRNAISEPWSVIRAECNPKEMYFENLMRDGDNLLPDRGRSRLVETTLAAGWSSIVSGCPELGTLTTEITALIKTSRTP